MRGFGFVFPQDESGSKWGASRRQYVSGVMDTRRSEDSNPMDDV
jgi:hypothetical protein